MAPFSRSIWGGINIEAVCAIPRAGRRRIAGEDGRIQMGKGMKAGKRPGGSNKGAGEMKGAQARQIQQMQAMQKRMEEAQAEIETREVETTAGGGAVKVKVSGKKEVLSIEISPDALDPDDVEMLQDLIVVAVNEGLRQIDEISQGEMGKLTGGLSIPGLI
jgi:DNA-binding YbaB/EbfC family protein